MLRSLRGWTQVTHVAEMALGVNLPLYNKSAGFDLFLILFLKDFSGIKNENSRYILLL